MCSNNIVNSTLNITTVKVYKYRWIILLIFCFYSSINFLQFAQYSIISNITIKYYNVEDIFVDLTEKYNLRNTALLSSGLTTLGNLIKLLSVSPDRFYVVLIGQALCAIAQVFMTCIPSKLASTWFGPDEVSTACAIAIFGYHIGLAIGFFMPSSLVRNSDNLDEIGEDFMTLQIINSSITVASFIAVLLFFRARPPLPPSQSQAAIIDAEKPSTLTIIKQMVKNRDYLFLIIVIGSSNGLYSSFGILFNGLYLNYFPGYEVEVGIIAALAVVAGGCIGSVIFGYVLDKWHHFKLTTFFIVFCSAVAFSFEIVSMEEKAQLATYFTIPLFGFFIGSTLVVGFEFATELMYPIPEAASCAILNIFIFIFSVAYTLIFSALYDLIGYTATNIVIVILLVLSSFIVYFIRPTLRRREANMSK
ncbi:feline leukemia virus subgroup C receptor-related protein 2-like isoform X2 [Tribolium madens]|uniref:feline leukemia virus subgroup C receptor-related protein 2-like isoform X2 n=1 Tax=Tribolium madens TaxID=41895 RepID=UPI001CF73B00|nr:feline leukemia virus subgroup C receptor-related protein 2-like isoform X2 [Tribolium madens]